MTRRSVSILVLVAVFVAGAACGVAGSRLMSRHRVVRTMKVQLGNSQLGAFETLGLSARQRAGIDRILHRVQPRSDSLLQLALPQLQQIKALADSADAEIRALLDPAQRLRMDSLYIGGAR